MTDLEFLPHISIGASQRVVLHELHQNMGKIVLHEDLLKLWPDGKRGTQGALNMVIHNLRLKLSRSRYDIIAHRGLGYALVERESADVALQSD